MLTAALHPHQALVIAGLQHDTGDHHEGGFAELIPELQEHGDIIAAYAATHVTIAANDRECEWNPDRINVPSTELDALADGITVSGFIACDTAPIPALIIGTSLLFDAFPASQVIVRLEYPDGFADKLTLTSHSPQGRLALETKSAGILTADAEPQHGTSRMATIIGWIVLTLALTGLGFAIYRMNIASPKE